MIPKIMILFLMLIILLSLGWGFYYLSRDQGHSKRTLHALMLRIGITILLALLLVVGIFTGVIVPHPIS